jgi:preprotein translocase subunit SecD
MKNISWSIVCFIFLYACSKDAKLSYGFIQYLEENKKNISIYLVNEEATAEFNNIYREYNESVFDIEEILIDNYIIPDGNKLFGYYKIKNNFEKTFFRYIILQEEKIFIGEHISKIKKQEAETNIILTCFLDSVGSKIFNEFTSNNIGKDIAIVFDDKIIVYARILRPLANSIAFEIDY